MHRFYCCKEYLEFTDDVACPCGNCDMLDKFNFCPFCGSKIFDR